MPRDTRSSYAFHTDFVSKTAPRLSDGLGPRFEFLFAGVPNLVHPFKLTAECFRIAHS